MKMSCYNESKNTAEDEIWVETELSVWWYTTELGEKKEEIPESSTTDSVVWSTSQVALKFFVFETTEWHRS